jgi:hypothetical protein
VPVCLKRPVGAGTLRPGKRRHRRMTHGCTCRSDSTCGPVPRASGQGRVGRVQRSRFADPVHRPDVRTARLGRVQPPGVCGSVQTRGPRGYAEDRRFHQGTGLLVPSGRRAEVLCRGQETVRQDQGRGRSGLPVAPLRVVGQVAAKHPDRFRRVRRVRLPRAPAENGRPGHGPHDVHHVRPVRGALGRDCGHLLPRCHPEGLVRQVRRFDEEKTRHGRSRYGVSGRNRIVAQRTGSEPGASQQGSAAARIERGRAKDHRPHRLSADVRRPRDRTVRTIAAAAERFERLCPFGPTVSRCRRPLQFGPVPLLAGQVFDRHQSPPTNGRWR